VRDGQLYYTFQVADVDFFVLDTRSYRSPNAAPDGAHKSLLGREQKADLLAWLRRSSAPFKVVASSVPMHDFTSSVDAWAAFATERAELLEFVRSNAISGVVVLSGDQHWSSLVLHGASGVWEFNSTPLAQGMHSPGIADASDLVLAYADTPAFGVVEVDTTGAEPTMTFSIVDDAGLVRGARTVHGVAAAAPDREPLATLPGPGRPH
jgi:alkaline phosphatase D